RAQFNDVVPNLVQKQKAFAAARERVRTDKNREAQIRKWCEEAKQIYTNLAGARARERTNPGAVADAQQQADAFMRQTMATVGAIIDVTVADAGEGEATYLIALAMHEQAERAQARYEAAAADPRRKDAPGKPREAAAQAWDEAKGWWAQYDR